MFKNRFPIELGLNPLFFRHPNMINYTYPYKSPFVVGQSIQSGRIPWYQSYILISSLHHHVVFFLGDLPPLYHQNLFCQPKKTMKIMRKQSRNIHSWWIFPYFRIVLPYFLHISLWLSCLVQPRQGFGIAFAKLAGVHTGGLQVLLNQKDFGAGWWYTYPSEKYESQLGLFFSIYGKIKDVPYHQSVNHDNNDMFSNVGMMTFSIYGKVIQPCSIPPTSYSWDNNTVHLSHLSMGQKVPTQFSKGNRKLQQSLQR